MPDNQHERPRIRIRERTRPERVGFGRPPRSHQFRPGQSGNPRGRPRGAKSESTLLRDILGRKIRHQTGDRGRMISILEGILLRMADQALRGEIKSATFLLNRFAALVSGELEPSDLSDDDRQILQRFAARMRATRED